MSDNITEDLFKLPGHMQDALSLWEYGLRLSSGTLVPSKSWVHTISFKWDRSGQYHYEEPKICDTTNNMTVKNDDGGCVTLEHRSPIFGSITLGIPQAPDRNIKDSTKCLRYKAKVWANKVRADHLPKEESWLCMNSSITRSLVWTLPVLCLSEKECTNIIAPVLVSGLS